MSWKLPVDIATTAVKSRLSRLNPTNYELCEKAIDLMNLQNDYGDGRDLTIIDAYPSMGIWSSALNRKLNPSKHILLEPGRSYHKFLESKSGIPAGSEAIKLVRDDPFRWGTFTELVSQGLYQPTAQNDMSKINPNILFTANFTHPQGEQLCAQYLNCMWNHSWLFQYGRVRMLLWVRESTAAKMLARPGERARSRFAVQCDAVSRIKPRVISNNTSLKTSIANLNLSTIERFTTGEDAGQCLSVEDNLIVHSEKKKISTSTVTASSSKTGSPVLLQIDPTGINVPHLDCFEFVIRQLFIFRGKPLRDSLLVLGAGAGDWFPSRLPADLLDKPPKDMEVSHFMTITEVFAKWPFKPEILHDFYDEQEAGMTAAPYSVNIN
ncbi:S-adenosyl-L-methionine-dependent methyltransferase [Nadsonia fulvescens var. elongata DSM 6958]|uniref:rRNA adenine N(6)-methyltransferase n=1 Tax=Nadsonia fulvescens var. elongata DSM 6958 TaxID=857566 RepID=A0A1E3PRU5_9ASCO|nr:S-adenosyl-L-methionine-dependent methyltransferase [Nadsonia fulvescens var. elongata DSM 6958]